MPAAAIAPADIAAIFHYRLDAERFIYAISEMLTPLIYLFAAERHHDAISPDY